MDGTAAGRAEVPVGAQPPAGDDPDGLATAALLGAPVRLGEDGLDQDLRTVPLRDRRRQVRAWLLGVDLVALLVPLVVLPDVTPVGGAFALTTLAVLAAGGAHRPRISLSALDGVPHLLSPIGGALLLVAPLVVLGAPSGGLAEQVLVTVAALVVARGAGYSLLRSARRRGVVGDPTLVLGGGLVGMDLLTSLYEHPEYGLRPVGFLEGGPQLDHRQPLGSHTEIEDLFDRYAVRTVIVAFGRTREAELVTLLRKTALRDIDIYIVPRFFDVGMAPTGPEVEDLWGVPLYRVRRAALRRGAWRLKRAGDVVVSGLALLLLAPLLAVIALAVRLSSPGPVLFRQVRTGRSGEEIAMLKFRSLRVAPAEGAEPDGSGSTRGAMQARSDDVDLRRTAVGAFLRRTSLDELPQLWNILRGDMSLVGPRPEETTYAVQFGDSVQGYRDRHRLSVGLTGWAQVNGLRGNTSIAERARFDNHYIEHWSLWRDVVIVLRTLGAVVRQAVTSPRGAPGASAPSQHGTQTPPRARATGRG